MTCNELYKVWLYNGNPNTILRIWDNSISDYRYDGNRNELTDDDINNLEKSTVSSFTDFYSDIYKADVLMININKLGE